jgi:hypothetical protein
LKPKEIAIASLRRELTALEIRAGGEDPEVTRYLLRFLYRFRKLLDEAHSETVRSFHEKMNGK